jgi:hypothetical protein
MCKSCHVLMLLLILSWALHMAEIIFNAGPACLRCAVRQPHSQPQHTPNCRSARSVRSKTPTDVFTMHTCNSHPKEHQPCEPRYLRQAREVHRPHKPL